MASNNQPLGSTDPTAQKIAFTRKKGTVKNVGYDFEELMTIFTLFELILDDTVKDFQISTNDDNLGCFDDIAISVEYKDGTTRKSALQLKHVENEEKLLQIEDLCGRDNKFTIARYCWEAQQILETDFAYILHTNRKLDVDNQEIKLQFKLPKKNNLELTVQLCKTGPEHIYTFQIDKGKNPKICADDFEAYQRFFQNFQLKTNQDNVEKLLKKSLEKWTQYFGGTKASFAKFNEFIKRWSRKDDDLEKLDKKIVIFKLVESLLSPYLENLIFSEYENEIVRILREAIMKFNITTFKTHNEFVKKMWLKTKSDEEIKKVGYDVHLLDENQEAIEPSDYMKILWHLGECPLIVKVSDECEKAINTAIGFLAKNQIIDRKLILLCYKDDHENTLNRFENLSDLKNMDATIYKKIVTKLHLHLQGRRCNLGEIITSEDAEKILTTDYLIQMAQSDIKICGEQESLPEFYVRRTLSRTVINPEFLKKTKSQDIIIISNNKEEASEVIKTTAGKIAKIEELLKGAGQGHELSEKCIVIQPSECTSQEFLSIRQNFPEKDCHHFKHAVEGLEWIESTGNIEELRSYKIKEVADEDELNLLQCSNRINIICAEPGLGKSTMLKFFKNSFDVQYWPLYLNSKEYVSRISDSQDIETFVFSCYQNIQPIEKDLLDIFYREKKIVFLWDSIDEVLELPKRNDLYKFMKKIEANGFKQWIASRSNIKWELEKEFNSFARNIEEFNEEQQKKYIEDRLSKKYDTMQVEIIFEKLSTNTKFLNYFNILGVPMQLSMLTELFLQKNFDFFNFPMTASKLYEHFINGKLESHFEKVKLDDEFTKETLRESYLNAYKIFGIKICVESVTADYVNKSQLDLMKKMTSKTLEKLKKSDPVGLIINYGGNELSFVHQTFAEYFAALFLSENFPTLRSLSDIYFDNGFNNVRSMLDLILCEECPAHLAVLYNNLTLLEENKDHVLEKDSIGRTALHVALSWTKGHLNLPDLTISRIFQQDHLEKLETEFKIVAFLLKYLTESQEKSLDLYDSSINVDYAQIILHAAVMSGDLEVVRFTVENYVSSVDNVNGRQETPLMFATFNGNYQIVEYLIENKANINAVNKEGWGSLYFATNRGFNDIFKCLFEKGADYGIVDCRGRSVLSPDILKDNIEIIGYLAKKREQINLFNDTSPNPERLENYVPRSLSRILVDINFLETISRSLVLISCLNDATGFRLSISNIVKSTVSIVNNEDLMSELKKHILFLENPVIGIHYNQFSQEEFLKFSRIHYTNCHHFKYCKGYLEWVESKDSVEVLRDYQLHIEKDSSLPLSLSHHFNELNTFNDSGNMNLIFAGPGMGKSTVLKFFHLTSNDGYWALPLNAVEHASNIQETVKIEEFLTLVSKKGCRFKMDLLKILIDRRRIIFLWDSLDELLNKNLRNKVYSFIKRVQKFGFVQWIAARSSLKIEIEEELDSFARSIEEFSELDKRNYIHDRLSSNYGSQDISIITDKIIENIRFLKNHCMYEIPIQLFMFTELILQNSNTDEIFPLTIVRLYDMIVNEKFRALFKKKLAPFKEEVKETLLKSYELLAVKLYFENILEAHFFNSVESRLMEELLKDSDPLGFIIKSNNRISFLHHTYTEYFTALFLSKHNNRIQNFRNVYFNSEFKNVRVLLDFILSENCPAHIAVLSKDLNMLKKHITEILNEDKGGRTAVHIAFFMGQENFEIPNVNLIDLKKMPLLDPIILEVINTIMKYLKETQKNPFSSVDKLCQIDCCTYAQGYTLHMAVMCENIQVVKFIMESCTSAESKKEKTFTSLMLAAYIGNYEIVKYLLEKQDVNSTDTNGNTALHAAAWNNRIEVAKLLIENNAQVNCSKENGWTPLMYAARKGYLEIAKCLIDNKAEVNLPKSDGVTALYIAASHNQIEVAKLLIENDAQVNCSTENGSTPLMYAAEKGYLKIAKCLIDNKAEVNYTNKFGMTPIMLAVQQKFPALVQVLMCAAEKGYLEIAKCLIDNKAEVNITKSDGVTALYIAASHNQIEVAKLLIENDAQVNCSTENGSTPLMCAAEKGYLEIAKCLIDNKAEVNITKSDGVTALYIAASHNQIEVAKLLIENDAQVNCSTENGSTPLMCAAEKGYLEIAKCLIDNKAEVNITKSDGVTALYIAASHNQIEVAKLLIENDAQVNCSTENGSTPLMCAAEKGYLEIAKCLIDNKAEVNITKSDGVTALYIAASHNQIEVAKLLIENDAQVNCSTENGSTPLMCAAEKGYLEIAKCLIDNKAEVNIPKSDGVTALYVAAWNNQIEVAKLLIENNAQVNCSKENGWTPLMYAAQKGYLEIAKCLIDNKAEVNIPKSDGVTALYVAAWNNQIEVAKLLIENNAQVNCSKENGWTPLMYAAQKGYLEIAKCLIDNKAEVNIPKSDGVTALYVAAWNNQIEVAKLLIENNAQVNCSKENGWTPLIYAAQKGYLEIAKCLIDNKAEVNLPKSDGVTALHVAAWNNQIEVAKLLIENNAQVNCSTENGSTPLMCAAEKGYLEIAKCLIDNKAEVNIPKSDGVTALYVAALNNQIEVAKLLIENNAQVNCSTENGWTPLMYAAEKGYLKIAKCLIDNKAEVNYTNKFGMTPIMLAVQQKFPALVQVLMHNSELEKISYSGDTAFHIAINTEQFEIAQLLIGENSVFNNFHATPFAAQENLSTQASTTFSNSVVPMSRNKDFTLSSSPPLQDGIEIPKEFIDTLDDINTTNDRGDTTLHVAVYLNKLDFVQYLIEKKVDVNSSGNCGWTPLMYAAQEGHLEIVKILIENQADINKTNNSGANALHIAAWNNQNDTARLLVEKNIKTRSFGSFGLTPLLIAVQRGNSSLAKCLIDRRPVSQLESIQSLLDECQSEVNCPDNFTFTPLMWAARKGYLEIAQLLIDNQANVNVCNTTNNTPLNFAAMKNKFEIVKLLVEQNANLNLASTGGWTPLWRAATRGYFDIVKYLFENGAAINDVVDRDGDTILSDAVLKNQLEISKYLMEKGAAVNIQANTGDTPLHYAVRNKNFDMVKLLVKNGADLRTKNHRGQTPQDLWQITEEIRVYLNCNRH